jgi:hypothetical protein
MTGVMEGADPGAGNLERSDSISARVVDISLGASEERRHEDSSSGSSFLRSLDALDASISRFLFSRTFSFLDFLLSAKEVADGAGDTGGLSAAAALSAGFSTNFSVKGLRDARLLRSTMELRAEHTLTMGIAWATTKSADMSLAVDLCDLCDL